MEKREKRPSEKKDKQTKKVNIGMPYVRGTSEALHITFKKYGVNMYHRPFTSIRQQLTHVKDKTEKRKKCGVVYYVKCEQCENYYIAETGRSLDITLKEHIAKSNSAIYEPSRHTGLKSTYKH